MIKDYCIFKSLNDIFNMQDLKNAWTIEDGTCVVNDVGYDDLYNKDSEDVRIVTKLKNINECKNKIEVGYDVTYEEIKESLVIKKNAILLTKASASINSQQMRNCMTIGKNIFNNKSYPEVLLALMSLDAKVEIVDKNGSYNYKVEQLYRKYESNSTKKDKIERQSQNQNQIVTKFFFNKLSKGEGASFFRLAKGKIMDTAVLNVAVIICVNNNIVNWVRISIASKYLNPMRATIAEEFFRGKIISKVNIEEVAKHASIQANLQEDNSISNSKKQYRKAILYALVKQSLEESIGHARANDNA